MVHQGWCPVPFLGYPRKCPDIQTIDPGARVTIDLTADRLHELVQARLREPAEFAAALAGRVRPGAPIPADGRLFIVAADHPARGALGVGDRPDAMENRADLLRRMLVALAEPGVDGVLGTADILEDLAWLGALDGKVVFGSMNRGGLAGAVFELDDRFTGYDAAGIEAADLDGGKMLLRVALDDEGTAPTLAACGRAVDALARAGRYAMVEPFWSTRAGGTVRNVLTAADTARAATIAAGLGHSSAHTWLKIPWVPDVERVLDATTLPCLLLGGDVGTDPETMFAGWRAALEHPATVGLVAGRTMLYPGDGDVASAVRTVADILHPDRR